MPQVMNPRRPHQVANYRTTPQKVCIGLGIVFVLVGLAGIMMPGFLGMHLSLAHNIIHLGSGALALWAGYADRPEKSYVFCLSFGAVYGLLGILGFIAGEPGYPGVGNMEADQNLLRILPNLLEFGTMDHFVHLILGAAFIGAGLAYKKHRADITSSRHRSTHVQFGGRDTTRTSIKSTSDINSRTTLGSSDVGARARGDQHPENERRL
jgi:hypothetical protein